MDHTKGLFWICENITLSESILCIPQQQSRFSHVLQVD